MLNARQRQRINVTKIKCFRSICNIMGIDKVRNVVRRKCENKLSLLGREE